MHTILTYPGSYYDYANVEIDTGIEKEHHAIHSSSLHLLQPNMKVFIYGILAVGMPHYGRCHLEVGAGYYLRREVDTPHDVNAVAVTDGAGIKKASLKRDAAAAISRLFDDDDLHIRQNKIVLKPKAMPVRHSPRVGLAQRCNLAFLCPDSEESVVRRLLSGTRIRFRLEP